MGTGAKDAEMITCAACGGRGQVVQGRGGFMIATTCRACGGKGRSPRELCPDCQGAGAIEETKKLEVKVPAGVDTGVRLRLQGEGDAGRFGGPPGDLYVFINVKDHHMFVREGADLHCELSVGFPTACMGGEAKVPKLVEGEVHVKIPAGMQPGDIIRIEGAGLPRLGGRGVGDLLVHLTITVPKRITEKQKKVLDQLAEALPTESEVSADGPERRETKRKTKKPGIFDRIRDAFEGE
jgi:molecular chaperone DnaJ